MPWMTIWLMIWPALMSLAVAALALFIARRSSHDIVAARGRTALAAGTAAAVIVGYPAIDLLHLLFPLPRWTWSAVHDLRFSLPLVLGLIAVAVISLPRRRREESPGAHLAPRTWRSFLATWWLVACLAVFAVIVGLTLAAGFASQPDDQGRYTMYLVDFGAAAAGSTIYGWHYSAVPLTLLVLTVAITWWGLASVARPPLATDHVADTAVRRLRSTNVARVVLGALLLHLTAILSSLSVTSSLSSTTYSPDGTFFTSGTPFSALTGALQVSAVLTAIIGLSLWIYTALTAVPSAARSARSSVAP